MLFIAYMLISAAAAAVYGFARLSGPAEIWKALLLFPLLLLSLCVATLLLVCVVRLFVSSKPIKRQSPLCRYTLSVLADSALLLLGIRMHIEGEKLLPAERFLMVSNHRSAYDPIVIMGSMGRHNISFVSKPSNLRIPVVGRIAYGAGYLPIDREDNRSALKTILKAAEHIKEGFCSMGIYPEGTRSKDGKLLPFHHGSFKIAQRAGSPLVIACTRGGELVKKNFPFRKTDVYLDILEVIPAEKVSAMSTSELSDHSEALIRQKLESAE